MDIRNVTIVGAGVMGSGIAQVIANSGFNVLLLSRRGKVGLDRVRRGTQIAVSKGTLTQEQASLLLSRITCKCLSPQAVEESDLVLETVIEDLSTKVSLFKQIDAHCAKHVIFASNTSSLSIASLAKATNRPDKVVGMHFFNPAPVMSLIEVSKAPMTSEETVNSIVAFSQSIGKAPLVVDDSPGFIVNKILMPMINSAAFVLMDNLAMAETIDSAMKLGANHPIGPLALADLIGLDVCLKIIKEINGRLEGLNFTICPLIEEMVAKGNLGRKTGQGFFKYENAFRILK
jgi:3-hydroxybutyryl-CoA dehydrogenase